MDLLQAIEKRYSCRAYQDRPVEKAKLDLVLQAARRAPSAKNIQDWRFVIVTDSQLRDRLRTAAADQAFVAQAPVVIVACSVSDYVMRCGRAIAPIDVSIALEHIALQAAELDLATCWIGAFYPEQVREILGIPEQVQIVQMMTLGYPADIPKSPRRLPIDHITCFNAWTFGDDS